MRRLIAVALSLACASPGMPPGGPPDTAAPQLVSISPDSGTVGVRPKEILFHFDEVVSERPPSVTSLSNLFLISPRNGAPSASWHRDVIGVRPGHGWQPNTAYTIIMQKGLADIRGNVRNTGLTTFFSTGPTIPHTRISGNVFDWISGSPAAGVMVESFALPDSVHPYIAIADSNGTFLMEHMPARTYTVRAYLDRNNNSGIDPSEPWDSVSVAVTDSARADLVIFVHDTIPPRIRDVRDADSTTLAVSFDKPINPGQTLTAANFAVIGPDSVPLPIISVGAAPRDTARTVSPPVAAPPAARPPVRAAQADTVVKPKPVMPKPVPLQEVQIKLQRPLVQKTAYRVRAIGIRGLLGQTGNSERVYTVPAPPPPPAAKPAAKPAETQIPAAKPAATQTPPATTPRPSVPPKP
ncbi:MAG TPA: Ig-like domain-containing protein [Gemmatimonadaceae bacterium]|nr:Ig-like domain-containing protein [Gemmatimonadaceae bacterium]